MLFLDRQVQRVSVKKHGGQEALDKKRVKKQAGKAKATELKWTKKVRVDARRHIVTKFLVEAGVQRSVEVWPIVKRTILCFYACPARSRRLFSVWLR